MLMQLRKLTLFLSNFKISAGMCSTVQRMQNGEECIGHAPTSHVPNHVAPRFQGARGVSTVEKQSPR